MCMLPEQTSPPPKSIPLRRDGRRWIYGPLFPLSLISFLVRPFPFLIQPFLSTLPLIVTEQKVPSLLCRSMLQLPNKLNAMSVWRLNQKRWGNKTLLMAKLWTYTWHFIRTGLALYWQNRKSNAMEQGKPKRWWILIRVASPPPIVSGGHFRVTFVSTIKWPLH